MIIAIDATSGFADKTQAAGIVAASLQRFSETFLSFPLGDVFVVKVALFEVPNGGPPMLS